MSGSGGWLAGCSSSSCGVNKVGAALSPRSLPLSLSLTWHGLSIGNFNFVSFYFSFSLGENSNRYYYENKSKLYIMCVTLVYFCVCVFVC